MTSSTLTPAEPIQKTVVTSQLIAAGGGCTACTMLSSTAELACRDRLVPRAERAGVAAGMTGCFRGYGMSSLIPVTGPAGNDPGRGSARPGQPSFTAVPEALTISMLLPTDS